MCRARITAMTVGGAEEERPRVICPGKGNRFAANAAERVQRRHRSDSSAICVTIASGVTLCRPSESRRHPRRGVVGDPLTCGPAITFTAFVRFPNVAAQRHSAWYPNHDAREDSDVAAAAEALRQRDPRDPSHDGDGNVMEGQRWGRRWRGNGNVAARQRRGRRRGRTKDEKYENNWMHLPQHHSICGCQPVGLQVIRSPSLMRRDIEVGEVAVKGKELKLYSHILAREYQRRHEKTNVTLRQTSTT
ncbi:hypothetical protein EDB84DRAFT_1440626 [Lactarius hengduanensis]|nr:hypothetical protein EDB84DRAFT_1440626 [Lactarius hengduanensis]